MHVGVSAYLLHHGRDYRSAGVSTYVHQLVMHLPSARPQDQFTIFHGPDAPPNLAASSARTPLPTGRPLVRIPWEYLGFPLQTRGRKLDIIHGTVNILPPGIPVPSVVTVHDLAFLRFPDRFPRAKVAYLRTAVGSSVRRAAHLIAVSEHTKQDLIDLLRVPSEKITVVYSGVDSSFQPLRTEEIEAFRRGRFDGRPYILYVGTLEPRKNLDVLLRAYARLRDATQLPHGLALVGARGWMYEDLFRLVHDLGLHADVHFVDYVARADLPLWYNGADLFAYPSAYEGFGLPVLEAMASGVPTITTASSALSELAGAACVTVEPGSEEALQVGMTRVLEDRELRDKLQARGLERAREFTWSRTACQTAHVYDRAVMDGER